MEEQLIEEFRRIPPEYRPDALAAFQAVARLAQHAHRPLLGEHNE